MNHPNAEETSLRLTIAAIDLKRQALAAEEQADTNQELIREAEAAEANQRAYDEGEYFAFKRNPASDRIAPERPQSPVTGLQGDRGCSLPISLKGGLKWAL